MENKEPKGRYTILKWNGEDSMNAKFVIQDNNTGKQAIFVPGRVQDIVWTRMDLANDSDIQKWEDFGQETIDDLESIAF